VSASKMRRAAVRAHHGGNRWKLLTCARRGHVTFAPEDAALANRLSGNTGVGEVWRSGVSNSMTDNRSRGEAVSVRGAPCRSRTTTSSAKS
jgi:hypothetical protein